MSERPQLHGYRVSAEPELPSIPKPSAVEVLAKVWLAAVGTMIMVVFAFLLVVGAFALLGGDVSGGLQFASGTAWLFLAVSLTFAAFGVLDV